jgi:hypothetical protein
MITDSRTHKAIQEPPSFSKHTELPIADRYLTAEHASTAIAVSPATLITTVKR